MSLVTFEFNACIESKQSRFLALVGYKEYELSFFKPAEFVWR